MRLNRDSRTLLERLAAGWRPLCIQAATVGRLLEKRALVRRDWGPEGTADAEKLCWYITDAGRAALAASNTVVQPEEPRARVLSDTELAAIWDASEDDGDHGRVVRLLLLTGMRRNEVANLMWSEVDVSGAIITLPPERTKNGKGQVIPLAPLALDIIRAVPRREGREHLFGEGANGFAGWSKAKQRLDTASGVVGWKIHDLRRTCATRMGELGTQPHVIEAALNRHSGAKRGVAGVYNRSAYEREVKVALTLWAEHVRGLVSGERKVVAMPSRAAS